MSTRRVMRPVSLKTSLVERGYFDLDHSFQQFVLVGLLGFQPELPMCLVYVVSLGKISDTKDRV